MDRCVDEGKCTVHEKYKSCTANIRKHSFHLYQQAREALTMKVSSVSPLR